jgi:hypothetical protein
VSDLPTDVIRFAGLTQEQQAILLKVHDMMQAIPFGTIELVMHQGTVVQIETSEKFRIS